MTVLWPWRNILWFKTKNKLNEKEEEKMLKGQRYTHTQIQRDRERRDKSEARQNTHDLTKENFQVDVSECCQSVCQFAISSSFLVSIPYS